MCLNHNRKIQRSKKQKPEICPNRQENHVTKRQEELKTKTKNTVQWSEIGVIRHGCNIRY